MASVIDICNLALSRLGDDASITSIDPADGSPQADHCARFYPMARDSLLESHPWSFATRRATLSLLTSETDAWQYAYAWPTNCLKLWAVQHYQSPDYTLVATDDDQAIAIGYAPQPFSVEALTSGVRAILTDQGEAAGRYTVKVTDPTVFSQQFTDALVWKLAAMIAGPLIKGDSGMAMAVKCEQMAETMRMRAMAADGGQRSGKPTHSVAWLAVR